MHLISLQSELFYFEISTRAPGFNKTTNIASNLKIYFQCKLVQNDVVKF